MFCGIPMIPVKINQFFKVLFLICQDELLNMYRQIARNVYTFTLKRLYILAEMYKQILELLSSCFKTY